MSHIGKSALLLACIALISFPAWSQASSTTSSVKVTIDKHELALQVTQPTSLQKILDSICATKELTCDIAPNVAESEVIVPVQLKGSCTQVVSQLLDGTKLNYAVIPGDSTTPGKLVVAANPGGDDTPHASSSEPSMTSQPMVEMSSTGSTPVADASGSEKNNQDSDNATTNTASSYGSDFNQPMGDSAGIVSSSGMISTPYTSPSGRPLVVPASGQPLTESPYSDPQGSPIKIYPNSRLTELPYSDSQGRPLQAPQQSGGPVGSPYPASSQRH